MYRFIWSLLLPFLNLFSLSAVQPTVYVANRNSNTVSAINTFTNQVIATIEVGTFPESLAITPDGKYVYVCNVVSNRISVISVKYNKVVSTIPLVNTSGPGGIAFSPDGLHCYVTNTSVNSVSVFNISGRNAELLTTIDVDAYPFGVAVTRDGLYAYIVNNSSSVSVIDTKSNLVTTTIKLPAGSGSYNIAISPNGLYAYITNNSASTVSVIDMKSNTLKMTISGTLSNPLGLAITPDGQYVYIANANGPISVIKTSTDTIFNISSPQSTDIAITPDGGHGYACFYSLNEVGVIGTKTNMVAEEIQVGMEPVAIAVTPLLPPCAFIGKPAHKDTACGRKSFNKLTWKPSLSSIAGYRLFRNGSLIATLSSHAICYEDPISSPNQINLYTLTAFNDAGSTSMSVSTTVNDNFWLTN